MDIFENLLAVMMAANYQGSSYSQGVSTEGDGGTASSPTEAAISKMLRSWFYTFP